MVRFIGTKLLHVMVVLLLVSFATFSLLDLVPGDPAIAVLGQEATPQAVDALHQKWNLDEPFFARYVSWLGDVLTGDLGTSFKDNRPIADDIQEKLPITLELAVLATLMALTFAVPVGVYQAYREQRLPDKGLSFASFVIISIPPFLIGVLLVLIFPLELGVFPVTGFGKISEVGLVQNLWYAFLPALTLALTEYAVFAQVLRSDMIATLKEDYVLAARAKGMPPRRILFRHALRPSSFSLMTIAGINLGRLLGGTVIVESIFGIAGIGTMMVQGIIGKDYVVVQAATLVIATLYVLINATIDVLYGYLDPRIRRSL